MGFGLLLLIVLIVLAVWAIALYNRLVRLRNGSESAWSDIDVQLKRRYELIPNLVETVKGYATHERTAFEQVTRARAEAMRASAPGERAKAEGDLSGVLRGLFAIAEAYPELRANQNFLALQSELAAIEEAIQNARRYYNALVRDLNTQIESFPANLFATSFGFAKKEYFELEDQAQREVPRVSFG